MLRAFILSLAMLFAMPTLAHAEVSEADKKAIDVKVDAFFNGLNAGKTEEAMVTIFLPRMTDKKLELQNLAGQTDMAVKYAGTPVKWVVMDQNALADMLVYRKYLVYSDDMPFKFTFVFFKTSKGWFAQSVNFSDINPSDLEK
ncbi:hypothetical protein [Asticcacaulis benevestitus]|uniref:Uncharacterized protein n=1 Tax=Asticcacaulis benevestitus DSM 16100 = ATCC BAA-896 TaxID=1121022 RepID=V4PZ77_9CAUL|nr:hypothetical protein [Asticcacaulis benevestitus]ESQ93666.1 hypothetical protein ABENE_04940 [Asticcacaulis benevestitus DSM 16100 = ATCC BAA-896]